MLCTCAVSKIILTAGLSMARAIAAPSSKWLSSMPGSVLRVRRLQTEAQSLVSRPRRRPGQIGDQAVELVLSRHIRIYAGQDGDLPRANPSRGVESDGERLGERGPVGRPQGRADRQR